MALHSSFLTTVASFFVSTILHILCNRSGSIGIFCEAADVAFINHKNHRSPPAPFKNSLCRDEPVFSPKSAQQNVVFPPGSAVDFSYLRRSGPLFMARPKKGAAGPKLKNGKVQVKITKFVEGTGRVGDIVLVAPAFWENKLKKTKSAVLISDEEVASQKALEEQNASDCLSTAKDVGSTISKMELTIRRKAGPSGNIFGGVGKKALIEGLKEELPMGSLESKAVKIETVKEEESGEVLKHDVKKLGKYTVRISLHPKVAVDFKVEVASES